MRYAWAWLAGRMPVVIARRSTLRQWERNGFELGRDYQRGLATEERAALSARIDQCNETLVQYLGKQANA